MLCDVKAWARRLYSYWPLFTSSPLLLESAMWLCYATPGNISFLLSFLLFFIFISSLSSFFFEPQLLYLSHNNRSITYSHLHNSFSSSLFFSSSSNSSLFSFPPPLSIENLRSRSRKSTSASRNIYLTSSPRSSTEVRTLPSALLCPYLHSWKSMLSYSNVFSSHLLIDSSVFMHVSLSVRLWYYF